MSRKEQAKDYILKLIGQGEKHYAAKTVEAFQLSRSTVYNYVSELVRDQIIVKEENGQYSLASDQKFLMYEKQNLDEERVFTTDIFPFLEILPTNVIEAWRYAFTAMMNNAIEHSETEKIYVKVIFKTKKI